jgi:hypothetical protein
MRPVVSAALAVAAAAALNACGSARDLEAAGATASECTRCHQLAFGPPLEIDGRLVTVHEFHIDRGVVCAKCHPGYSIADETVNAATHANGTFDASVAASTYTKAATFSDPKPTWPQTCSGCHTALPPL